MESMKGETAESKKQIELDNRFKSMFELFELLSIRSGDRHGHNQNSYHIQYLREETENPIFEKLDVDMVNIDFWQTAGVPVVKDVGGKKVRKNIYRPQLKLSLINITTEKQNNFDEIKEVRSDSFLIVDSKNTSDDQRFIIIPKTTTTTDEGYKEEVLRDTVLDVDLLSYFESLVGIKNS